MKSSLSELYLETFLMQNLHGLMRKKLTLGQGAGKATANLYGCRTASADRA